MLLKKLKRTPHQARIYLMFAALLIALPSIASLYNGHEGKFLVATGVVEGSPFEETVIYLNRHDFWGAHGVVINRPARKRDVKNQELPELKWNVDLYEGGPVGFAKNNFLLLKAEDLPQGFLVTPVETVRRQKPEFIKYLDKRKNSAPLRLFLGFSGWGVWQLNREIAMGAWAVIDYDENLMFHTSRKNVWKNAMKRVLESRPAKEEGV